jgi:hypothetical protein
MAHVSADRVRDTSTSTGTGAFVVSGTAPTAFRTFSAVLSTNDTFYYAIQHQTANEWEIGLGTYSSANTITRTTVYASSAGGSAVTFSSGTKDVFITLAADRSVQLDNNGAIPGIIDAGNLTFTGTARRITGDMSNATIANRLMFQTSTANAGTTVGIIPNGTSNASLLELYGSSTDQANTSYGRLALAISSAEFAIASNIRGTGTYLPMTFYTGGSERMRVATDGSVGIGGVPAKRLEVITSGTTTADFALRNGTVTLTSFVDSGAAYTGTSTNHPTLFLTNNAERMRIDSSGNVGIGTSSPGVKLQVEQNQAAYTYSDLVNTTNGGGAIYRLIVRNIANTGTTSVDFAKLIGSGLAINNNDTNAANFTSFGVGASERMRIDSSGNLLVGTTNSYAPVTVGKVAPNSNLGQICAAGGAAGDVGSVGLSISKFDNNTTTSQRFISFLVNNTGAGSGQINANGANAAAFGSYSDQRLKENIVGLPSQLDNICALRPVEFDYKDGSGHQIGFIAQEMQEVYPDAVGTGADDMLTVTGWSKTEARLVAAIQELKAQNDELKARVAALENA